MKRLAVFVSGSGSNLQAVIEQLKIGEIPATISCVISNKKDAYALQRARKHGIQAIYISRRDFPSSLEYEKYLVNFLKSQKIDYVILAGFLYIFSEYFVEEFKNRIVNIHPSLLPAFGGKGMYGVNVHKSVLEYGMKVTGATVHFVDAVPDGGPIILQKAIYVKDDDTPETLQKRVLEEVEWKIYPLAIKLLCEDKIEVVGRKVIIKDKEILKKVGIEI